MASTTRRGFSWQGAGRSGSRAAPCGKSWRHQSTGRRASWSSAASPWPASARKPPFVNAPACLRRTSGRTSAPTGSTAMRRRTSGRTRRCSPSIIASAWPRAGSSRSTRRTARTATTSSSTYGGRASLRIAIAPMRRLVRFAARAVWATAVPSPWAWTPARTGYGPPISAITISNGSAVSPNGGTRRSRMCSLTRVSGSIATRSSVRRGAHPSVPGGGHPPRFDYVPRRAGRSGYQRSPSGTTLILPTWPDLTWARNTPGHGSPE